MLKTPTLLMKHMLHEDPSNKKDVVDLTVKEFCFNHISMINNLVACGTYLLSQNTTMSGRDAGFI